MASVGDQSDDGGGLSSIINTECSKSLNLALPLFSLLLSFSSPHPSLSPAPSPYYLSALSYHCCDYGCHAVVKRTTINRPEIKPKNEFPQCRPHALLGRNYLGGEWLITPLRRQRQKHRRRDCLLTEGCSKSSFSCCIVEHKTCVQNI